MRPRVNVLLLFCTLLSALPGVAFRASAADAFTRVPGDTLRGIILDPLLPLVLDRSLRDQYGLFRSFPEYHSAVFFHTGEGIPCALVRSLHDGQLRDSLLLFSGASLRQLAQRVHQWPALRSGATFQPAIEPRLTDAGPLPTELEQAARDALNSPSARSRIVSRQRALAEHTDSAAAPPPAMLGTAPDIPTSRTDPSRKPIPLPGTPYFVSSVDPNRIPFTAPDRVQAAAPVKRRRVFFSFGVGAGLFALDREARIEEVEGWESQHDGYGYDAVRSVTNLSFVFQYTPVEWGTIDLEASGSMASLSARGLLRPFGTRSLHVFAGLGYGWYGIRFVPQSDPLLLATGTIAHVGLGWDGDGAALEFTAARLFAPDVSVRRGVYHGSGNVLSVRLLFRI